MCIHIIGIAADFTFFLTHFTFGYLISIDVGNTVSVVHNDNKITFRLEADHAVLLLNVVSDKVDIVRLVASDGSYTGRDGMPHRFTELRVWIQVCKRDS